MPVEKQRHEPLAFLGRRFRGSERNWPIVEKEGAAIIFGLDRGDYLVQNGNKFNLYTDHSNLTYILDPPADSKKHTKDRLLRWRLELQAFDFQIRHIVGKKNVWADLLTRWGANSELLTARCCVTQALALDEARVYPLEAQFFDWPCDSDIRQSQAMFSTSEKSKLIWEPSRQVWVDKQNRVVIPESDVQLQLRILIAAHAGAAGHRASEITLNQLQRLFWWKNAEEQCKTMCDQCLHCVPGRGGNKVPRPLGHQIVPEFPFQVLHMDYFYMEPLWDGDHSFIYVLLLRDGFSGLVRLVPSASPDELVAANSVMQWCCDFKAPQIVVSDQGTHFKNKLFKSIEKSLNWKHSFTTAYSPWANGSVERAGRELIKLLRILLDENKLQTHHWPSFLMLIQHAMNHSITARGREAPITIATSLPPDSPLTSIFRPDIGKLTKVKPLTDANMREHVSKLKEVMAGIHKTIFDARQAQHENQTRYQRNAKPVNFVVHDYVLVAKARPGPGTKLQFIWQGPYRVSECVLPLVYKVENLVTGDITQAHATRMRLYADSSLNVTADILARAAHGNEYHLDEFVDLRFNPIDKVLELLVQWTGFGEEDRTWEQAIFMVEDARPAVNQFLRSHAGHPLNHELRKLVRESRR